VVLPTALDRVLRDYEMAWEAADADALAALFTEDGFVLASGKPPVRNRPAIRQAYARAGGTLRLRALQFATDGDLGFIIGAYTFRPGGVDQGKFILALRRMPDGRWLIAADIDNSSMPSGGGSPQLPPRPPYPLDSQPSPR
jgi:uncharacterized protein (TIGR02246 family)